MRMKMLDYLIAQTMMMMTVIINFIIIVIISIFSFSSSIVDTIFFTLINA